MSEFNESELAAAAAAVADKALLVLTPDAVALRDGKIVADRLAQPEGRWRPYRQK